MLYYDRIDISNGIDLTKSNNSKEYMICYYWFFNHGFEFQDSVCNGCHDLTILSVNIRDIAIITVKNVDYCCIGHNSKSEAINLLKNSVLEDRRYIYKKNCFNIQSIQISFLLFLLSINKMVDIMDTYEVFKYYC